MVIGSYFPPWMVSCRRFSILHLLDEDEAHAPVEPSAPPRIFAAERPGKIQEKSKRPEDESNVRPTP
jgi:hypothetical protein